jgi:hypothetical protein
MAAWGAESPGSLWRGGDRGGVTMAGRGGATVMEVAWRGEAATGQRGGGVGGESERAQ